MTNHIEKAKAALESCDGWPVNGTTDMALLAIANALVAIAEGRVKQNVAHNLHHIKPRTLESVLADLANEVWEASCTCQTTWSDSGLDGIEKKYADEIRELMEVER